MIRPRLLTILLATCILLVAGVVSCVHPAPPQTAAALPAHPSSPLWSVVECQTIASDFASFYSQVMGPGTTYSPVVLQLHLHMPQPMVRFSSHPLVITEFRDDLGTDLRPQEGRVGSTYWPAVSVTEATPVSPDSHHVILSLNGGAAPAPGATRLTLRGVLTVPVGCGRTVSTFRNTPLEMGTRITAGPLTLTLQRADREPPRQAYSPDRMLPTCYTYRWDVDGPVDQIESIVFLDAAGKAIPCDVPRGNIYHPAEGLSMTVGTAVDTATVCVTWFESAQPTEIPVELSTTLSAVAAPATQAVSATMPAAAPASRPAGAVRIFALSSRRPVDKVLWSRSPITDPPDNTPSPLAAQSGLLLSCGALFPDAFVARFDAGQVVVDAARDDQGADLLGGVTVRPGLSLGTGAQPAPTIFAKDRHACFFAIHLPTPLAAKATRVTIRGHLVVDLAESPRTVSFPAGDLQPGKVLMVGPYPVTIKEINASSNDYDFEAIDNPLIQGLVFRDERGQTVEVFHFHKAKSNATTYRLNRVGVASLEFSYFADTRHHAIPFTLTASVGL